MEVKAASDSDAMSIFEEEVESLRAKVDELSEEVRDPCAPLDILCDTHACIRGQNFETSSTSKLLR